MQFNTDDSLERHLGGQQDGTAHAGAKINEGEVEIGMAGLVRFHRRTAFERQRARLRNRRWRGDRGDGRS